MKALPQATKRECGTCSACCIVPAIPFYRKGQYEDCVNLAAHGCGDYERRCLTCKLYTCLYLDGEFGDGHRPNEVGVVLEAARIEGVPGILAREVWDGAAEERAAANLIWSIATVLPILVTTRQGMWSTGPSGEVKRATVGAEA